MQDTEKMHHQMGGYNRCEKKTFFLCMKEEEWGEKLNCRLFIFALKANKQKIEEKSTLVDIKKNAIIVVVNCH